MSMRSIKGNNELTTPIFQASRPLSVPRLHKSISHYKHIFSLYRRLAQKLRDAPKEPFMKYGYARVSTEDQNTDLQLSALKRAGCTKNFVDKGKSGATLSRPALKRCLKQLECGDMLIVWKLDRLGRSVRDVVSTLHDLTDRGV